MPMATTELRRRKKETLNSSQFSQAKIVSKTYGLSPSGADLNFEGNIFSGVQTSGVPL